MHMKNKIIIGLLSLLFISIPTYAKKTKQPSYSGYTVSEGLNKILANSKDINLRHAHVGIIVQSLTTGKVLFARNPDHLLVPASVLKLFTAAAALAYLKPDFRFHTSILTTGKIHDGVLNGNVYFKFTGDPNFKIYQLAAMVKRLKHIGVDRIKGHVYIDNFAYNDVPYPPGWIWDDLTYSYAAPMDAIIINKNRFGLKFSPSKKLGTPPRLWTELPPGIVRINNRMITTKNYRKHCPIVIYSDVNNHYRIGGCLDRRWGKQQRTLALRDMVRYLKVMLASSMKKNEIQFKGPIYRKHTPENATVLVRYTSKPLKKIVYRMLKDSDNLVTNSLLKKVGQKYYQSRGGWQNGIRALKRILNPTRINFKNLLFNDGAGLSRLNLVSARQLVKLLNYAYRNKTVRPAFVKALPIAGHDGTLGGRMLGLGRSRRIHAKTGTMTGVTSLAGYAFTKHNGPVAFAIMVNGFVKPRRPFVRFQDRVCQFLVNAKKS